MRQSVAGKKGGGDGGESIWRWIKIIDVSRSKYLCVILCWNPPDQTGGDRGLPGVGLWQVLHHLRDDSAGVRPADDRPGLNCHRHDVTIVLENLVQGRAQLLMGSSPPRFVTFLLP